MKHKVYKKVLSLLLSAAILFSSLPLALAKENDKISIATINDTHYYSERLAGDKREDFYTYLEAANCVYNDLDAILDAAFESLAYEVKHNNLKYIVVTGDLTTNGEYEGHVDLSKKFLAFEKETGANIYVTPGNHDINNSHASSFVNNKKESARITTPEEFATIYSEFGFNEAYHKFSSFDANKGGSLSYSIKTDDGYRLILADGGKFTADVTKSGNNEHETGGSFTPELLQWIIDEAKDAANNDETPLLFTHWNMSGMNYLHEYLLQGFVIDDHYILQELLADSGINYSFSGHQHVSDVSITYSDAGAPMYSVITPTLSQFPFAYRVTEFTKTADGLDVTFNQKRVDEYSTVKTSSGASYPTPYVNTGFYKQFGGKADATEYLFGIIKKVLDGYFNEIRAEGSFITFLENKLGISIETKINQLLFGGIKVEGLSILSADNFMALLKDIDLQLMENVIYPKAETYAIIKDALRQIIDTPVSEYPCTKFIDTYGFGNKDEKGTLGDAVLSIIAYMYMGNEDISEDVFLNDFIEFTGTHEFFDTLINVIKDTLINGLILDDILSKIDIEISPLFLGETAFVGGFINIFYIVLVNLIGSGLFNAKSKDDFVAALTKLFKDYPNVSIKYLIETVLGTGVVPYGKTIDEVINSLLNTYLPEDAIEATLYQAHSLISGMVTDDTKDWDVTYENNGKIKVIPTEADMQIPVNVITGMTENNSTSFTVSWFTKYSITATDIEVVKAGEVFTGVADVGENITASTVETEYSAPGFDAGAFGILPWTRKVIKHTVTVTDLLPDTKYLFKIGDFEQGFTTQGSVSTAPETDGSFTFINVSDTNGYIPSQYENLKNTMIKAQELYPDFDFTLHGGNIVNTPNNDNQWTYALSALNSLNNGRIVYAVGDKDAEKDYGQQKYFMHKDSFTAPSSVNNFYSFDYGSAHFVVIDSLDISDKTLSKEQQEWLKADLEKSNLNWNILVMHKSIYSENTEEKLRTQIEEIMSEYKIDLLLQGGENSYIRMDILSKGEKADYEEKQIAENGKMYKAYCPKEGTITLISGSAGHTFADTAVSNDKFACSSIIKLPSFSAITVKEDILTVDSFTVDENTTTQIDSFALYKDGEYILPGDVTGDGKVKADDARLALRSAVNLEALSFKQWAAADINRDKDITAEDARTILRISVNLEKGSSKYIFVRK